MVELTMMYVDSLFSFKQNEIICVSHFSTYDKGSKYIGHEIYYTNLDGVVEKIIGTGWIVSDIARNSNN